MEIAKKDKIISSLDNIINEKESFLKNRFLELKGGTNPVKDLYRDDFKKELMMNKDIIKRINVISNHLESIKQKGGMSNTDIKRVTYDKKQLINVKTEVNSKIKELENALHK